MLTKEREIKRDNATKAVKKAIDSGELTKGETCELCGCGARDRKTPILVDYAFYSPWTSIIVAHHWRGYDYPLDVWFICQSCNVILGDRTRFTKDQAIEFVAKRREMAPIRNKYYILRNSRKFKGSLEEWLIQNDRSDLVAYVD